MNATPFQVRLDFAREVVAARKTLPDPSVAVADQVAAASADALGLLGVVAVAAASADPNRVWTARSSDMEENHLALAVAATVGLSLCPHLRRGGVQPAVALLASGRLACRRCARTVTKPVVPDEVCDLCERPTTVFFASAVEISWVILIGDFCAACAARFGIDVTGDVA